MYILLLLTVCFEAFLHIRETSKAELSHVFLGVIIFLILCQKLVTDDALTDRTYLLSASFLVIYALLLHKFRDYTHTPRLLTYLTVLIIVLESGSNMLLTSVPTVSRTNYLKNYTTYNTLMERQAATESNVFYRYEKDARVTNNDGMLQDYPSSSLFSSTSNGLVNSFYNQFGFRNSKVFYSYEGATPLTSALLSTKYFFSKEVKDEDSLYTLLDQENDIYLYENTYSLPLGFMITPDEETQDALIEDKETAFAVIDKDLLTEAESEEIDEEEVMNPIERQNLLAQRLGASGNLFERIETEADTIDVPQDAHVYVYCNTSKFTVLTASCNGESQTFKKMKNKRILDLGYRQSGSTLFLSPDEDTPLNMTAYILNEDVLADLMAKLNTNTMTIESFASTKIVSDVTADQDGYLILSIPYDPGFTITVDGLKTETELFEEMMIAVPITAGSYTITIHYYPDGLNTGIAISLCSILIFLLVVFFPKYKNVLLKLKKH